MNYDYEPVQGGYPSFESKARSQFVSKVYSLLAVQLSVTACFVCFSIWSQTFAAILNQSNLLFFLSFVASIGTLVALSSLWNNLVFNPKLCKTYPTNMILLTIFTLGESYLVSYLTLRYEPESVLMAAIATAGATLGLTLHAFTTKTDYTKLMHFVGGNQYHNLAFGWSIFWVFLFLSMFNVLLFRSSLLSNLMALVIAGIYSVYILIDTQLVLGGKNKELTLDNYVLGAMILYVDIVQLFLKILQLLGEKKKK